MVESMSNFAISLLLVIGYYWITVGDLKSALSYTLGVAIFFMFPTFTLWSLAGLVFKTRVQKERLYINLGVSVLTATGFALFLVWVTSSSKTGLDKEGVASLIGGSILVGVTSVIGGLLTYRFVIDDKKPRLKKTAYTTINTGPQVQNVKTKSKSTANQKKSEKK